MRNGTCVHCERALNSESPIDEEEATVVEASPTNVQNEVPRATYSKVDLLHGSSKLALNSYREKAASASEFRATGGQNIRFNAISEDGGLESASLGPHAEYADAQATTSGGR